jgi:outer membrane protein
MSESAISKTMNARGFPGGRLLVLWLAAAAGCAGADSRAERPAAPPPPGSPAPAPVTPGAREAPVAPPPAPEGPLTLEQCLAIALSENPARAASLEEIAAREAGVGEASGKLYPSATGQMGYSRWQRSAVFFRPEFSSSFPLKLADTIGPLDDISAGLSARYVLFAGGAQVAERRAALALRDASREDAEQVRQDISFDVRQAYYGLLAAEEIEKVALSNLKRSESNLKTADDRLAAGAVPKADVLKARVDRSDADLSLVNSRNLVRVARGQLNTAMGRPVDSPTRAAGRDEPPVRPEILDLDLALEDAIRGRPALRAAEARLGASREAVAGARASFWPTVSAQASYGVRDIDFPPEQEEWLVGVGLELQLFDGFARTSRLDRAKAELSRADAEVRGLLQRVKEEIWNAHSKVRETFEALAATEALVRDAAESQRVAKERYAQGAGTILDLLDAEVALSRAEARRVEARFDHQVALAGFKRAAGRLE